jgi:hypothetical protein
MTTRDIGSGEAYLHTYRRLADSWILITCNPASISLVEDMIYTPGTDRNADLELALIGPTAVMLGRKRPELRTLLKLDGDPWGWDSLFLLDAAPANGIMIQIATEHFRHGLNGEHYLENFVKRLLGDVPI